MPGPILLANNHVPEPRPDYGPWWVKAIQMIGVPAVVSLVLLWWMLTAFDNRLNAMAVEQSAMFRVLTQICVNTAVTQEQRNACWNPYR